MRNILENVRKSDHDEAKAGAQAIYRAPSRAQAEAAFRRFRMRWRREYGSVVRHLERDLPELLSFFAFPSRSPSQQIRIRRNDRHRRRVRAS